MMRSKSFATHEVKLTGRKDATSLAGLPALSRGMMMAIRQIRGRSA